MCDFDKDGANRAGGTARAMTMTEMLTGKPPKPQKRIRPRNGMKIYGTFEVVDESEYHYICNAGGGPRAYEKEHWEEVPKRVVWRDVTKEVKDICFVHGKETVRNVIDPDFEITIKRRFEVEG